MANARYDKMMAAAKPELAELAKEVTKIEGEQDRLLDAYLEERISGETLGAANSGRLANAWSP
jgi:hypothetical protein